MNIYHGNYIYNNDAATSSVPALKNYAGYSCHQPPRKLPSNTFDPPAMPRIGPKALTQTFTMPLSPRFSSYRYRLVPHTFTFLMSSHTCGARFLAQKASNVTSNGFQIEQERIMSEQRSVLS